MKWEDVSFLLHGKTRREVLRKLTSPRTATMLAKSVQTHRSSVSRILSDLQDKGFVKCLDLEEHFNRFYERTQRGKAALKKAEEVLKKTLDKYTTQET